MIALVNAKDENLVKMMREAGLDIMVEREDVWEGVMPRPPKPDNRPRPKDRKRYEPAPPPREEGKLTALQAIALLAMRSKQQRKADGEWTVARLAEAFHVDEKKLATTLRHIGAPVVYEQDGEIHADWEVPIQLSHGPTMVLGEYLIELQRTRILNERVQRMHAEQAASGEKGPDVPLDAGPEVTPGKGRSAQLYLDPLLNKMKG